MHAYALEIALVVWGLILLLVEAFATTLDRRALGRLGMIGVALVFAGLFFVEKPAAGYWGIYATDPLALFYKGLALISTFFVLLMGIEYAPVFQDFVDGREKQTGVGEFLILPLFICAGLMWMASMTNLTGIFVTLEMVTISFYVLVAAMRRNAGSLEAGVKYLILGALSTGILVYGIAWVFGLSGSMDLTVIKAKLALAPTGPALFAIALVLTGLAFKMGAVPFQFWVPDVYQGAPTPVTAYLSVGSKAGGVIIFTRILESFIGSATLSGPVLAIIGALAGATLLVGNLAAIPQGNFKRLLAYSSISHAGFILLAFAATGRNGSLPAPALIAAFYLGTYLLMTLASFLVLTLIRREVGGEDLKAFDGLSQRSKFLSLVLLLASASLAGIPFTAGFFGKFFVIGLIVQAKLWPLLALAILGAAAGFYYYFKVIRSMFWHAPVGDAATLRPITISLTSRLALSALSIAILVFGIWPGGVMKLLGN
jgi:NADH-quinone oxidoreductase subunit N